MKTINSYVKSLIDNKTALKYFVLVRIGPSGSKSITASSLPFSIAIGNYSYISSARLLSYDPPRQGTMDDRNEYSVVLSDLDQDLENKLIDSGFSAEFKVMVGFYDPASDDPIISSEDYFLTVYEGIVDSWVSQMQGDQRALLVKGTNPMGSLDWANPYYTSVAGVRAYRDGDTSMDMLGSTSADDVTIKWGKKYK